MTITLSQGTRRALAVALGNNAARAEIEDLLEGDALERGTDGAASVGTVSAAETGVFNFHNTVLTLSSTLITVGNTTGVSFGGVKIYDFPEGRILLLGLTVSLSAPGLGNAGNATPIDGDDNGDFSLGSTVAGDGTLTGADVDMCPSTAYAMDTAVTSALAASAQFDGTSTAIDMYLNMLIDDADVGDGASDILELSGTVNFSWINLGDF